MGVNLISQVKGRTQIVGVREQGAQENIWMRNLLICTLRQLP
jgi:hypothetical protein